LVRRTPRLENDFFQITAQKLEHQLHFHTRLGAIPTTARILLRHIVRQSLHAAVQDIDRLELLQHLQWQRLVVLERFQGLVEHLLEKHHTVLVYSFVNALWCDFQPQVEADLR
jgi:hypothetical protein